jgi:hypothetical protein
MKTTIRGHKIETTEVNSALSIVKIDGGDDEPGGAQVEQINGGRGKMTMTATAWNEAQHDLIAEVFPNLPYEENFSDGLSIWKFRAVSNA